MRGARGDTGARPGREAGTPSASDRPTGWADIASTAWVVATALVLALATLFRIGLSLDGLAWSFVQIVLVGLAAYDLATRRLPNRVTYTVSVLAIALRAVFERGSLAEVLLAGAIAFGVFLLLALVARGGLGMGDVKLAGMLGFLLGREVLSALLVGVLAGGIAATVLLVRSRGNRRATFAYGPYLAFGGAVVILVSTPPPLL